MRGRERKRKGESECEREKVGERERERESKRVKERETACVCKCSRPEEVKQNGQHVNDKKNYGKRRVRSSENAKERKYKTTKTLLTQTAAQSD